MRIGVVIPTLEEEALIERTLDALLARGAPAVTVVADCGSRDDTVARARRFEGVVVMSDAAWESRAAAMGAGAARALLECPGLDALWFLHADATPPDAWDDAIGSTLADDQVVGGAFDFEWDDAGVDPLGRGALALFRAINRIRFRLTRIYFGDQGIFARVGAFQVAGGMPDAPLLEDVILSRRLRRLGHLRLAPGMMRTSPRRFVRHGVCRQVLIDGWLLLAERLGRRPEGLHAWYNQERA